jgi:hypothetical protein
MMAEFLTRLRFLVFRKKHSELDDELRFHLEQSIAAKVAAGLSAAEARRQALIEFGGVERAREECDREVPDSGSAPLPRMRATVYVSCAKRPGSRSWQWSR